LALLPTIPLFHDGLPTSLCRDEIAGWEDQHRHVSDRVGQSNPSEAAEAADSRNEESQQDNDLSKKIYVGNLPFSAT
jgi:hypothetical protein